MLLQERRPSHIRIRLTVLFIARDVDFYSILAQEYCLYTLLVNLITAQTNPILFIVSVYYDN